MSEMRPEAVTGTLAGENLTNVGVVVWSVALVTVMGKRAVSSGREDDLRDVDGWELMAGTEEEAGTDNLNMKNCDLQLAIFDRQAKAGASHCHEAGTK